MTRVPGRTDVRRCTRCGEIQPTEQFRLRNKARGWRQPHCRRCERLTSFENNHRRKARIIGSMPESCYLCGTRLTWRNAHIEHRVPKSKGGRLDPDNMVWSCRRCNRLKDAMTLDELREAITDIAVYQGWFPT